MGSVKFAYLQTCMFAKNIMCTCKLMINRHINVMRCDNKIYCAGFILYINYIPEVAYL